jgi:hypothetical protein
MMIRILAITVIATIAPLAAGAEPCPGNPQALGTERVIEVDAMTTPRVGRKQFTNAFAPHSFCWAGIPIAIRKSPGGH